VQGRVAEEQAKRGARGKVKVVESSSELVGMRPLGLLLLLIALCRECSPSRSHSSGRYRGLVEQKAQGRDGEVKLLSMATTFVGLERIVWEYCGASVSGGLISQAFLSAENSSELAASLQVV
jgi:hypothetical protein